MDRPLRDPAHSRRSTALIAAAGLALWVGGAGVAGAAELPPPLGVGTVDRRVVVDPATAPWNAIAKVQTNIGTRCSGALVAPSIVLTAAHCLYNRLTRAPLQPVSLHVLIGYQRGAFRWHRTVARFTAGAGFAGNDRRPQPSDWACLELTEAIPAEISPLPVYERPPPGTPIALAGYNRDHAQLLMADQECRVTGVSGGFLLHDCDATHGTSGAPLLSRREDRWAVIAINIGAGLRKNLALAPPFSCAARASTGCAATCGGAS